MTEFVLSEFQSLALPKHPGQGVRAEIARARTFLLSLVSNLMIHKITRLQADALLLFAAIVWGFAFVAQKAGMVGLGPLGFIGIRFSLSALFILPFFLGERSEARERPKLDKQDWLVALALVGSCALGVYLQQVALLTTTVTNSGFLSATYVVMVPVAGLLIFRHLQSFIVWPACLIVLAGVYLLNGASLSRFALGDWLTLLCAVSFAFQINFMGIIVRRTNRPFLICMIENLVCAAAGLVLGALTEGIHLSGVIANAGPLLYAGLISGGIGFGLQAFAQQHTPSSDAAIILSGQALFAAAGGCIFLHEVLGPVNWLGCTLIFAAILLVQLFPFVQTRLRAKAAPPFLNH